MFLFFLMILCELFSFKFNLLNKIFTVNLNLQNRF